MVRADDPSAARAELDKLLQRGDSGSPPAASSDNSFRALRLVAAESLPVFLGAAVLLPAAESTEYQPGEWNLPAAEPHRSFFDEDGARALTSRFPLALLDRVARDPSLPPHLRRDIAVAAWTRAVVLGAQKAAIGLAPVLAELEPELRDDLNSFDSATSDGNRQFAAVFLLLRNPGMRPFVPSGFGRTTWGPIAARPGSPGATWGRMQESIARVDSLRDNWWCALNGFDSWRHAASPVSELSPSFRMLNPDGRTETPLFLSASQIEEAAREWERLCQVPTAPVFMAKNAITFAQTHTDDRRVPEALHLVVRATRYGCVDVETSQYSRRAFKLLHRRYPNSEWARKTKYWY